MAYINFTGKTSETIHVCITVMGTLRMLQSEGTTGVVYKLLIVSLYVYQSVNLSIDCISNQHMYSYAYILMESPSVPPV